MNFDHKFETILNTTYTRMHRYSCAEAVLGGLLDLWDMSTPLISWGAAGYLGAIQSGRTSCGLLIGSSVAVGLRLGKQSSTTPFEDPKIRKKTIRTVKRFYKSFLKEYGHTDCKSLCDTDFSNAIETARYLSSKQWKTTCDVYLNFVMQYWKEMTDKNKI